MSTRTLFGHPIRFTTEHCHEHKITLDEFVKEMHANLDGYAQNMRVLGEGHWSKDPRYIEQWVESMLAWSEIEEDRA